jgi:DNA-binding FadR family transcriptional regulator
LAWQLTETPDARTLRALNEVRLIFEPAGARLAAERADEADLAAMAAAMAAMRSHHGDVEAVIVDDVQLHRAILVATHNLLMPAFESLIEAGLRARNRIMLARVQTSSYLERHAAVVRAIANRDGDAAEAAMRQLLSDAAEDDARVMGTPEAGPT